MLLMRLAEGSTRAALANERAAHVLERRRFSDHVAPVIGAARIRADQQLARERRERVLDDVSAKARDFIRRAVLTCAFVEVRDARRAERGRARIEARLSAACDRKEAYLLERVQPLLRRGDGRAEAGAAGDGRAGCGRRVHGAAALSRWCSHGRRGRQPVGEAPGGCRRPRRHRYGRACARGCHTR